MGLLLHEARKIGARDTYRAGIIMLYAEYSPILERIDMLNIAGGGYGYNLRGKNPGVGFRGVNESWTPSLGVVNPQFESLKIAGGSLVVDNFITETGGEGVQSAHEAWKVETMAKRVNKNVIKGNSESDAREFDGLNTRLTGSQDILAGAGGAALTQDMLDDLLRAVPGANAIICGDGGHQLMTKLLRGDAQVGAGVDAFGRQVVTYNGKPILNIGLDDEDNDILDFNEDPGDAVADTTSIYAVRMGIAAQQRDFFGIQSQSGIMTTPTTGANNDPTQGAIVEWYMSIVLASRNCAARLRGILNAVA